MTQWVGEEGSSTAPVYSAGMALAELSVDGPARGPAREGQPIIAPKGQRRSRSMQYGTSMTLNPDAARRARASPCAAPGGRSRRRRWRPGSARRRPPAVERSGGGRGTSRVTGQRPQRSGPAGPARGGGSGSTRRMDGDDSRGTLSAGDTLPIMGQAVLVDVRPQWSRLGAAAADKRRGRRGSGPGAVARRAHPGRQQLRISPVNGQRRQSGYSVERRRSPSWGRQCSVTSTRSGAGQQRQINGEGGGSAAPAQWTGGPSPGAAAPARPGE